MKKNVYVVILMLVVVSVLMFSNHGVFNEIIPTYKSLLFANKNKLDERKKWEATPDGVNFKKWKVSPKGKKVQASYDKIKNNILAFNEMKAQVTSVTFQRADSKLNGPKWLIVKINNEEYMMQFIPKDFQQLNKLKVNDQIIVKSRSAGYSPNHPYLIISGDFIAHNNKVLFKRDFSKKNRC